MPLTIGESSSSSTPYTSSSTPKICTYHVFLSFRGEDTRTGFTDHLYAALERKGITTFRDDKYLERGQVISKELIKAIQESMFAITILSQHYASSTWCLDELQKIMECNNNGDLEVFPVFYGVDPSDVRHQRGSYEEAFKKHQEKLGQHSDDRVKKWRDALAQVANYAGWDSKNQHEAELVEIIAQRIHEKLVPKLPSCTENLVGIASKVKEVKKLIGMGLNDVRFIGIWGLGGIGKTTIARAVFEAIRGKFEVTCFLANVREVSERNGLDHIQRQLLSHLSTSKNDFNNLYDGKKTIQNSLCRKKVLLVLDDVNDVKQLENLAGKQDWFGPGSRVLITTRDKHMLITHGIHKTYEVVTLLQKEALNLFCLKAFKGNKPQEGYLDLSKKVVEYSGGLPLALEVLGSYLYGRNIDVWHSAVKKLTSVPHREIKDNLMISYEGLDSMEKNIFLDIACFFKGCTTRFVTYIIENCGYSAQIVIEVLVERSLITLRSVESFPKILYVEMHDLLQQMGRDIVIQKYLGKSSSSSSPYTSSSTPKLCTYHEFLSFRREDARKGFTYHLCAAIKRQRIFTYDTNLERGQVISKKKLIRMKAVKESISALVILSQDYTFSICFFDELKKIIECNNNRGLEVFPVFYGVELGQRSDRVKKWRDALTRFGNYAGWNSKDWNRLVEIIAPDIHFFPRFGGA